MHEKGEYFAGSAQGWLCATFLHAVGMKIANPGQEGIADLDLEANWLNVLSSYTTEQDKTFKAEWFKIQEDRRHSGWEPDADEQADLTFRIREMNAIVRSLARQGILTRLEAPRVEWDPGAR